MSVNTYRLVLIVLVGLFVISAAYGMLGDAVAVFFVFAGLAVLGLAFTTMLGRLWAGLGKLRDVRRRRRDLREPTVRD